jgi:hypothetical protein
MWTARLAHWWSRLVRRAVQIQRVEESRLCSRGGRGPAMGIESTFACNHRRTAS